jgi:hypothetical protein
MASSCAKLSPASFMSWRMAGSNWADDCCAPGPLCCQMASPRWTATNKVSVLVSMARRFMFGGASAAGGLERNTGCTGLQ